MNLNYKKTILIGLGFFSINAFWQLYEAIIPLILSGTFGIKETLTGMIMALDNVLALFMLPFFGALSDGTKTKFGKRIPYIIVGTIMSVILMLFIPVADNNHNFWLFFVTLFFVLMAMGIYRSPAVALMPDLTPKSLRSQANAIINLMGTMGTLVTLLLISILVQKDGKPDYSFLFMSVAFVMVISVAILAVTVHEKTADEDFQESENIKKNQDIQEYQESNENQDVQEFQEKTANILQVSIKSVMKKSVDIDVKSLPKDIKKSLIFLLLSVFFWFAAFNAITSAFSRYAVHVLGFRGGSYASVLLVAMIIATIGYVPMGFVSSILGRKKTVIIGVITMTVCYFIATFFNSYSPLIYVIFAFTGFGWAAINVNAYPMVVEMSNGSNIGKYTGLYYTFSTGAQIITPILSGFLLENISYRTLFPYATLFSIFSFLTIIHVKHGDSVPPKNFNILKNFDVEE